MKEIYEKARDLMKGYCRVCPVCDGKACRGEVPGMGGIGTGSSFEENFNSLKKIKLNMKLIHNITKPDTSINLFGRCLDMPVLAAPIGGVSYNMGGKISEDEYAEAIVLGCLSKKIMGTTGDGVPEEIHMAGLNAMKKAHGHAIPFIKPWEDKELFQKLEKAHSFGAEYVGMDIDAAGLITLGLMGRPVSPKTPEKLKEIIQSTPMKFIVKGIMTVEDALLAAEAGAYGIVVSNHGGRVLDFSPGTADVLPAIASTLKDKVVILVDGGVRTGTDVLKMLALGADAVMLGRPFTIAAMGGMQAGVEKLIDKIKSELVQAMILTGTASVSDVSSSVLYDSFR
ncbi:MAG: alpha-hydroxy-acid oxidizing protein [Desulfobacteraceae bacterium]|nr:alpha-hydroxy-acid oxidizing protein [Desulfobacteraceae bacterium]MCB9495076.1 alpha-hydroxy-acid oxidizing protein [Desulfobacteraceae bacterium]